MPILTTSYFLGTNQIGSIQFPHNYFARSRAFFCPRCGEVWGRIHVHGSEFWDSDYRFCYKHRDLPEAQWCSHSGMFRSIWSITLADRSPDINLLGYLPKPVLIHDFLIASENFNAFVE